VDKENRGFLTPAGFAITLRLIGHAQAGREPTPELALQQAPLPRFEGLYNQPPAPVGSPPPPAALQAQGSGGPIRIPPLTPEKVAQYGALFESQPLQSNALPGDQARSIFEKSGLSNEVLGKIWQLADTEQRGALVQTEFIIAMHLLSSMKTGTLRSLPNILPPPLYEAATRRVPPVAARMSPNNTGPSAIPRQLSGTAQARTASPLGRPPTGVLGGPSGPSDWLVTPADKARFDRNFAALDIGNKGYITGEEAVPFLGQSGLDENTLAQIWDLSDILERGQLSREEFAVAMYLIRELRGNRGGTLPKTLPPNLVPPNMRSQVLQKQQSAAASAFDAPPPPPPQPKSALDDLFDLANSAPPVPPQATGGSNSGDPFAGGSTSLPPSSPVSAANTGNKSTRFVPSSSFGRGLAGDLAAPSKPVDDDLLGDNDPEISKKLTGETTELANLSNQIGSLSEQMKEVQGKRTTTQNELNQTNSQKQNFEQRLNQLRTLYEKEAKDTKALQEQLRTARADTQKLQGECMNLDTTYRDVQTQHQELLAALQADQQENARLRERIRVVNAEIAQLKPQIDKLKSDARQQKGLVAINKKQLSTTEGERDKLKTEADELTKAAEEASRQANTASPASSTQVASPALSTSSGNNPFFKRTASTDIMGAFASPAGMKSVDDVFGPAFSAGSTSTPPPPTSFSQQNTGNSNASFGSVQTPPASSPTISRQATLANEPPAPPQSRQISSSFLPFPDNTDSLSSSRQVSPPASRAEVSSNDGSTVPAETPASEKASNLPGAFPGDDDDKNDTSSATPTQPTAPGGERSNPGIFHAPSASDPFANMDKDKAREEFESAFAAHSGAQAPQEKPGKEGKSVFDSEFPPISHLERDDDSDSDSEGGGFDDDFAPASPPQAAKTAPGIDSTVAKSTEEPKTDEQR
jgi:epidermal growth factor receptor substrate 15